MWTSSHWPGRNCTVLVGSKLGGHLDRASHLPWALRPQVAAYTSEYLGKPVGRLRRLPYAYLVSNILLLFALHGLCQDFS